jgi:peroxiredoxin
MCQGDAPGWERVYERTKQTGVKIIGIAVMGSRHASQEFVHRYHLAFPNAYDPNGDVARLYEFSYQPYWAVIAKDGSLLQADFLANEGDLAAMVKTLVRR